MQNFHVVSRSKFHVLSKNGAIVSTVSLILCTGNWIKLFIETVLAFNPHFQHIGIGLSLQESQLYHSKARRILVWKQH